jgi:hypothetical protein
MGRVFIYSVHFFGKQQQTEQNSCLRRPKLATHPPERVGSSQLSKNKDRKLKGYFC